MILTFFTNDPKITFYDYNNETVVIAINVTDIVTRN